MSKRKFTFSSYDIAKLEFINDIWSLFLYPSKMPFVLKFISYTFDRLHSVGKGVFSRIG